MGGGGGGEGGDKLGLKLKLSFGSGLRLSLAKIKTVCTRARKLNTIMHGFVIHPDSGDCVQVPALRHLAHLHPVLLCPGIYFISVIFVTPSPTMASYIINKSINSFKKTLLN